MQIKKAVKSQSKLKLALAGAAGSGKTYSALAIGAGMLDAGQKMGVIDTERGSASLYSDIFSFDVIELDDYSPRKYIEAMQMLVREGYNVIVIDSLSHAWSGKGGALEMANTAQRRGKNSFTAWADVTPEQNALVDAMLQLPAHLIVTMRTKTEWVIEENERGKMAPKKIGTKVVQRDDIDYEFTLLGEMDQKHVMTIGKTRVPELDGKVFERPGRDVADMLRKWLGAGTQPATPVVAAPVPAPVAPAEHPLVTEIRQATDKDVLLTIAGRAKQLPEVERGPVREAFLKRQAELGA